MPTRALGVVLAAAALVWPAAAPAATSDLAYPGGTVTVTGNPSAFSVTVAHLTRFVIPGGFENSYRISSSEGFANASAKCTDTSGSMPPTTFDCDPVPAMTAITGSPLEDTIAASAASCSPHRG